VATASLVVFIETNRSKASDAQHYAARPVATSDSGKLIGATLAGLALIWRDGYRWRRRIRGSACRRARRRRPRAQARVVYYNELVHRGRRAS
jgi:hypothetical protein